MHLSINLSGFAFFDRIFWSLLTSWWNLGKLLITGLWILDKPVVSKLHPILSAINTDTSGWAKFFVPLLKCFIMKEYTIKDSFKFAKDLINQNSKCFMV